MRCSFLQVLLSGRHPWEAGGREMGARYSPSWGQQPPPHQGGAGTPSGSSQGPKGTSASPPERPLPGLDIPEAGKRSPPPPPHLIRPSWERQTPATSETFGKGSWHLFEPFWKHLPCSHGFKMSETYFPRQTWGSAGDVPAGAPAPSPAGPRESTQSS